MKKGCLISIIIVAVIAFFVVSLIIWGTRVYNNMVTLNEGVTSQWGNVETAYQRRADLIPNFVNTVKGAADFEQSTLTQVIEARAKATQVTIDPTNMTAENMQQFQQAQGELSSAISRLMVVVEQYPQLKATQNFRDLQVELEGTENRISVERRKFNELAMSFNTYIKRFPQSFIAGPFGFGAKPYFEAQQGAERAPEVKF
ncbi:MAG: LemA family protein [Bacteroidetes bacterium GWF2_41_9]|nr:MAG: LemA family protein [Bacteroidetes bacterium GWA2_40_15]OFY00860.1 MAG: LemA family protein [Bacteroidetes bacterium GWC2_40_22]OFY57073.1 MAG: LemA family protein [Bacteroidetes bacterium GWF2_41_9]HAM10384.1 LemA family protein [Bacteroidales bacterium]HBH83508.1 LemA family protein [Bacteroidales bacterium]